MGKVYLAGFDVFRLNAIEHGQYLQSLCAQYGLTGLYPMDNMLPLAITDKSLQAEWIYQQNIAMIREADAVMANLNNFRGHEPDSGTAFEVGFAVALGKPVWVYLQDGATLLEKIAVKRDGDVALDQQGYVVEDFGLSLNLMLACSTHLVVGGAEDCLKKIASAMGHMGQVKRKALSS